MDGEIMHHYFVKKVLDSRMHVKVDFFRICSKHYLNSAMAYSLTIVINGGGIFIC
jgi:hypothetical protein